MKYSTPKNHFAALIFSLMLVSMATGCSANAGMLGAADIQDQAAPGWAMNLSATDAASVYAVGSADGISKDLAMDKAKLQARFRLAALYRQAVAGNQPLSHKDDAATIRQNALLDELVQESIAKATIANQQISNQGDRVRVWVRMQLPYSEFDKVLQARKAHTANQELRSAFEALEQRIGKHAPVHSAARVASSQPQRG